MGFIHWLLEQKLCLSICPPTPLCQQNFHLVSNMEVSLIPNSVVLQHSFEAQKTEKKLNLSEASMVFHCQCGFFVSVTNHEATVRGFPARLFKIIRKNISYVAAFNTSSSTLHRDVKK